MRDDVEIIQGSNLDGFGIQNGGNKHGAGLGPVYALGRLGNRGKLGFARGSKKY